MSDKLTTINLKKGEIIAAKGEDADYLFLVLKGHVKIYSVHSNLVIGTGCIAGIIEGYYGIFTSTYAAEDDVTLLKFSYGSINDIVNLLNSYQNSFGTFVMLMNKQIVERIKLYLSLFKKCRDKDSAFTLDVIVNKWELDKYNGIASIPSEVAESFYSANVNVAASFITESAKFAATLNDACTQMAEFLNIDLDYAKEEVEEPEEDVPVIIHQDSIMGDEDELSDEEILLDLHNSLTKILTYANADEEDIAIFKDLMNQFKRLKDPSSFDDDTRKLKRTISEFFYKLYQDVFMTSMNDDSLPIYIKMFLNFGFLDDELLSSSNKIQLFKYVQKVDDICNNSHVYTLYNWLKHIMWGEKEPSKNELDQSYSEHIKALFKTGKLGSMSEQEALEDTNMKIEFEIQNMFKSVHRMVFGHASSFLPFITDDNIFMSVDNMFISAEDIMSSINKVRSIDFSLFYRTTVYSNVESGISKEYIYTEVLPDIVLIPGIGTNGAMWQEIEGRSRNSSARFMLPILFSGQLDSVILNILGKFRWELCRRIQGVYWNTISEKSLTSEYYDYLQFYKKNRDLTESNRDKIKSALTSAHNNYGEVFARDYELWITFESKGISRLNKSSRQIIGKYCPFNAKIRDAVKNNPSFTPVIDLYDRERAVKKRRIDNLCTALQHKGIEIPREIRETKAYLGR